MRIADIDDITKEDLVEHKELVEAFKNYVKKEFYYDDMEANMVATDLENPYNTPFFIQDYEGEIEIDGIVYIVRSCRTQFSRCGLYHLDEAEPFEFYMLFNQADIINSTVGEYQDAHKLYVI